jgi:predicted enzyme related to lactoylglutathione lyase
VANPVVWFEVVGKDGARPRSFYERFFDWKVQTDPTMDYGMVSLEDKGIGGGIGKSEDGGAGRGTCYVEVGDLAASVAKEQELGGPTVVPPTEIPGFGLTFALVADPVGHVIGLSKGAVW